MDVDGNAQYTTLKKGFNIIKNTLRRSINEANRLYYTRTFVLYKHDVKQTWAVLKDTLQTKMHSAPSPKFTLNNDKITNIDEIVKEFNTYFINIGRTLYLTKFIQHILVLIIYQKIKKTTSSFVFNPVSEECIANVITKLKINQVMDIITFQICLLKVPKVCSLSH